MVPTKKRADAFSRPGFFSLVLTLIAMCWVGQVSLLAQQSDAGPQPRYLDSPFGTTLQQKEFQQQATSKSIQASPADTIVWPANASQLVVECRFILADESTASEFFKLVDANSFQMSTAGIQQDGSLFGNDADPSAVDAKSTENIAVNASIQNFPATWGNIGDDELRQIVQLAKGRTDVSITQAPTVTMFEGQSATVFDGSLRPFVVGVEPLEFDSAESFVARPRMRPVIQPIEEGTILRFSGRKIDEELLIDAKIIMNQVESVDEVKLLAGQAAGTTLQVPKCLLSAVKIQTRLASGETVLVDTGRSKQTSRPIKKRGLQKLPYVGTMVGSTFQSIDQRILVLLTVREIKPESE